MDINQLIKQAEQGDSHSQNELGKVYLKERAFDKGVVWLEKSAQQGYVNAQYNLALCYEYGVGVAKDLEQAIIWYWKAAEQGDIDACIGY